MLTYLLGCFFCSFTLPEMVTISQLISDRKAKAISVNNVGSDRSAVVQRGRFVVSGKGTDWITLIINRV